MKVRNSNLIEHSRKRIMMLKYKIKTFIQQLRNTSNSDYEFIRWLICVFTAGAVYSIILYQFGTQLISLLPQLNLPTKEVPDAIINTVVASKMVIYGSILFVLPPLISIISTRLIPEKRIVPSFYIHLIASGYMSFYFSTYRSTPEILFINVFVLFAYSIFVGLSHDSIVRAILGRNVREKDVITYS